MKKKMPIFTAVAVLVTLGSAEAQQVRDFGEIETKSIETREAGIGGLRLEREGPEESRRDWIVTADAFGLAGEFLGVFEIRYPELDTVNLSFVRADNGATYRVRSDEATRVFEFEHVGVESFTLRPLCDPGQLTPRDKTRWSAEEIEDLRRRQFECSSQIEITGTSKTWQDAIADYQEIIDFLAAAGSEVRNYFGIPTKGQREARERLERLESEQLERVAPLKQGESTNPAAFRVPPTKFGGEICAAGQEQFCPFGDNNFAFLGEGSCAFCNKSDCCAEASENVGIDCKSATLLDCCANSFCTVTTLTGCGLFCNCQLIGYYWGCRDLPC